MRLLTGDISDVHLDEQGNADDAGDADAIHGMRVSSAAWVLLRAGRWSRQMHLQASDEEEADQAQALRHGRVQFPERRDGDGEDDQVGQETGAGDGVTGCVFVDAVAVWNRLVPEVGERPTREHDR